MRISVDKKLNVRVCHSDFHEKVYIAKLSWPWDHATKKVQTGTVILRLHNIMTHIRSRVFPYFLLRIYLSICHWAGMICHRAGVLTFWARTRTRRIVQKNYMGRFHLLFISNLVDRLLITCTCIWEREVPKLWTCIQLHINFWNWYSQVVVYPVS